MKKAFAFAVLAAVLAPCLAALAGGTLQPADMTAGQVSWPSEKRPGDTIPPAVDQRVADDWKCTDGQPIGIVRWWGTYHPYQATNAGPVDPPAFLPTSFVLRQYENDAATDPANPQPGAMLNEVVIPIADCNQAYLGTVDIGGATYNHVFSYEAVLATPWAQTKDSIYWLSVQAQFDRDPTFPDPPAGDGYLHWEWVSTPAGDFLGRGQVMLDGAPWAPVEINPGDVINFAFEIGALPVDLAADKTTFQQTDAISVIADVAAISTPCWPFVRIRQPNDEVLYLEQATGFVAGVAPYLGIEAGPIALPLIADYPILQNAQFRDMPKGTYYLEGGAVDPVTTDINNLQYVGVVSRKALVIE